MNNEVCEHVNPTYLGDGVYADFTTGMIMLSTPAGGPLNTIYLEPEVYQALVKYADTCWPRNPRG
jgi:hypothetical protein